LLRKFWLQRLLQEKDSLWQKKESLRGFFLYSKGVAAYGTLEAMKQWAHRRGFTIVELLIVIVVIAILAAITIVAYNGIQNRARQSAAQTLVSQAQKKVLAYAAQNSDMYPPSLQAADMSDPNNQLQYTYNNDSTPRTYGITATNGNFSYYVSNSVTSPVAGGYPGHGQGGVAVITNLHMNPTLGTNTNGWSTPTSSSGASLTPSRESSGGPVSGVPTFLRFRNTTTFTGSPFAFSISPSGTNGMPVEAGSDYSISMYYRTSCSSLGGIRAEANFYNSTGTFLSSSGTSNTVFNSGWIDSWRRYSRTIPAPADASFMQVSFAFSGQTGCATNSTFDISAVMVVKGGQLYNYADGNFTNWAWNGTQNNSASTGMPL
jgi:prepilin-type N-terminal cleavage/methylation domain-containing protein